MTEDPDEQELGPLFRQMAIGVAVMMVGVGALAAVAATPLEQAAAWFVEHLGIGGVFFGVLLTDSLFLTNEPLLFLGYQGGLGYWTVFWVASIASVLAGPLGWTLGRFLGRSARVQDEIRKRRIDTFLHRYGFWAVTVAALTPIPYSLATWASGAARIPLPAVLLGSLFRVPKTLFYYLIITGTWQLATRP